VVSSLLSRVFRTLSATEAPASAPQLLPAPSYEERRNHPRFELRDATCIYLTQRPMSAVILDVSTGGLRFATRLAREVGTVVGVALDVDGQVMVLPLRVLWERWSSTYFEHGGVFVDLTADERAHLQRYVAWACENPPDMESTRVAEMLVAKAMEAVSRFKATH